MNEQALKARLKEIAKNKQITFNEAWRYLLLERFLSRVSASEVTDKLIFKGGLLLAYYLDLGRETKDIDFLLTKLKAEEPNVIKILNQVCNTNSFDNFNFNLDKIEQTNHLHMFYSGFRAIINVSFGNMKSKIQLDIAVGDKVSPNNENLGLLKYNDIPLFENNISLYVYPVETIIAEKLETVIRRDAANSRMKDFHDLVILKSKDLADKTLLKSNILSTFNHRKTKLAFPVNFNDQQLDKMNTLWQKHLEGLGDIIQSCNLPKNFREVINELNQWMNELKISEIK